MKSDFDTEKMSNDDYVNRDIKAAVSPMSMKD